MVAAFSVTSEHAANPSTASVSSGSRGGRSSMLSGVWIAREGPSREATLELAAALRRDRSGDVPEGVREETLMR